MRWLNREPGRSAGRLARYVPAMIVAGLSLPTAVLIWMLSYAVSNERDAVYLRLRRSAESRLERIAHSLDSSLASRYSSALEIVEASPTAPFAFQEIVDNGLADSAIIEACEWNSGYPGIDGSRSDSTDIESEIAKATALRSTIREHLVAKNQKAATTGLKAVLTDSTIMHARDETGRAIYPALLLLGMSVLDEPADRKEAFRLLAGQLQDYRGAPMPGEQRRFLMNELLAVDPSLSFPTKPAEDLASGFLLNAEAGILAVGKGDMPVTLLYRPETLNELIRLESSGESREWGDRPELVPLSGAVASGRLVRKVGASLPGWGLEASYPDADAQATTARRQVVLLTWGTCLVIAATVVLAIIAVRVFTETLHRGRARADAVDLLTHEFATPVTSIRAIVDQMLESPMIGVEKRTEYLRLLASQSDRLERLVSHSRNMLNEFSDSKSSPPTLDLSRFLQQAVLHSTSRLHVDAQRLAVDIPPALGVVRIDPTALSVVVDNLLDNAVKFSEPTAPIEVRASSDDAKAVIEFRDRGIGISSKLQSKIFDRFYRVDDRLSRSSEGLGLGLAIVKAILKRAGGSIHVESELDKGSRFIVELPLLSADEAARFDSEDFSAST